METKKVSNWNSDHVIAHQIRKTANFLFANAAHCTAHHTLTTICKLFKSHMSFIGHYYIRKKVASYHESARDR
jgi:hypothetical protein